jgi:hypothetical protein
LNGSKTRSAGEWIDMTPSDWLDVTPSEWMERALPGWRKGTYGTYAGYPDIMRTTPRDWLSIMYAPLASQAGWPTTQPLRRHRYHEWRCGCHEDHERGKHHRHHSHGCRHCGSDPCECYCCIGDVDVVVYTRVGEKRIVPITVENDRRREQEIKVDLSDWTMRGGKAGLVETVDVGPKEFTLAPCGEQDVKLVVDVRGEDAESGRRTGRQPDVDTCVVATADLRLVGCDHRPLRIAAAILPRDCDPFRVSCGCTCC